MHRFLPRFPPPLEKASCKGRTSRHKNPPARVYCYEEPPGQWGTRYPSRETVEADITGERCYVCEEEGRLYAAFILVFGEDPTYRVIDGAWKNDRPYATLHRVASSGKKRGMVDVIVKWAFSRHPNLRGDTHERNLPMRRAFERNCFERCGTIWVEDGTPRIAYQKEG